MKNLFILLLITLFFSACTLKKVQKHHGVFFLVKKYEKLIVFKSNKNDILTLLGPPSTKSAFDNDLWIYIERTKSNTSLLKFNKEKISVNNVLLLEIDNMGMLKKKELLDINGMQDILFTKRVTGSQYKKNTFVYDFLSSMRQKINDPLGNRRKRK